MKKEETLKLVHHRKHTGWEITSTKLLGWTSSRKLIGNVFSRAASIEMLLIVTVSKNLKTEKVSLQSLMTQNAINSKKSRKI